LILFDNKVLLFTEIIMVLLLYALITADFVICDQPEGQYQPCALYFDSTYYVFWSDHRNAMSICGTRVLPNGTVVDTTGCFFYYASTLRDVRAAHDGTNLLIVFRYGC
jgi:hypothetical protein